jgi:hypothetical protein
VQSGFVDFFCQGSVLFGGPVNNPTQRRVMDRFFRPQCQIILYGNDAGPLSVFHPYFLEYTPASSG